MNSSVRRAVFILTAFLAWSPALAQPSGQQYDAFKGIGIDEKLGHYLPTGIQLTDHTGKKVALDNFFDGKRPVLLNLVYFSCPMLCNLLLDEQAASLKQMDWVPGQQYEIVTVSFAPWDTPKMAADAKSRYIDRLGRPEAAAGWHFLVGDTASVGLLTRAVGFKFKWVAEQNEYAHPASLIFISGDRKISRYLFGLSHPPRDIRNALVETSQGKIGNVLDQVILYCFKYDHNARGYVLYATNVMKLGGLLTLLALGTTLTVFWRRERLRQKTAPEDVAVGMAVRQKRI